MKNAKNFALSFWNDTQGQDLVEYALAAGLIAVAAVAAVPALGETVKNLFGKIQSLVNTSVT
jgi:pilus assembly protein Flp/PilA